MLLMACLTSGVVQAVDYPPRTTEITPERPLFIFDCGVYTGEFPDGYAADVAEAWTALPAWLQPYSALGVDAGAAARAQRSADLMSALGTLSIPLVLRVAVAEDATQGSLYDPAALGSLLNANTQIIGVDVTGLRFNVYDPALGAPPHAVWLARIIDTVAKYGRFTFVALDEVHWARAMSNIACAPLYDAIRSAKGYVVPSNWTRGDHHPARHGALMGLWLEDAVSDWGMAIDARWYRDAHFISPGVFGASENPVQPPPSLYRAMILLGAQSGATVYRFQQKEHLWFGGASTAWDAAIAPTLHEMVDAGWIARKQFVAEKARLAYQLRAAANPVEFHENLRDIDAVLDAGHLVQGVYGIERVGQIPELIPNQPGTYWVPLLSYHATQDVLSKFGAVVQPGSLSGANDWGMLAERYRDRQAMQGDAYVVRIGRAIFVMNSAENSVRTQHYAIAEVPAAVRGLTVVRNGEDVVLEWPFREGDISYQIYRCVLPETTYTKIAAGLDRRTYTDVGVGATTAVVYAVAALTNEQEPLSGTVSQGEHLVFSTVESRIAEEAVLTSELDRASARPLPKKAETALPAVPWWPSTEGLAADERAMALGIAARIEAWDQAIAQGNLNATLGLYHPDYVDPQGWGGQYVRRAYQWLFERYRALHFHRQIRRWDFSSYAANGQVHCLLYCRISGIALTDASGRIADVPMSIPRTPTAEVWVSWTDTEGVWRITSTNPALPNFGDLLSYAAGPYDGVVVGPDIYREGQE